MKPQVQRDTVDSTRPLAACTIVAQNYLAHARTLAQSFRTHHPRGSFYVLVLDGLPPGESIGFGAHALDPQQIGLEWLDELLARYDVREACTAIKPAFLQFLLEQRDELSLVYLDPDILVVRSLRELEVALDEHCIVLTPHLLSPPPVVQGRPFELTLLLTGIFNLGFIGLRRSPEVASLLEWWGRRLRHFGHYDVRLGQFFDQKWMDLAPVYFPCHVLESSAYDVACWNLSSRVLERSADGDLLVDGLPLALFHFSMVDFRQRRFSDDALELFGGLDEPVVQLLLEDYCRLLESNGFQESASRPYGFGYFETGEPFHPFLRRLFDSLASSEKKAFGNPRSTGGSPSFRSWALHRDEKRSGLSPFLHFVHQTTSHLKAIFPLDSLEERLAFARWILERGGRELGFDPCEMNVDILVDELEVELRCTEVSMLRAKVDGIQSSPADFVASREVETTRNAETDYVTRLEEALSASERDRAERLLYIQRLEDALQERIQRRLRIVLCALARRIFRFRRNGAARNNPGPSST